MIATTIPEISESTLLASKLQSKRTLRTLKANMPSHFSSQLKTVLHCPLQAKLISNSGSGQSGAWPQQWVGVLSEMQNQHPLPKVYLVQPDR